ncbi:hypothetical protein CMK11_15645 [Candidatus Poribacteria bacterium]|nr:hypothetical protein [Candidatus Poribacteria bacterium]
MPYAKFDRSRLTVKPLAEREHDLDLSAILPLEGHMPDMGADAARKFSAVGAHIAAARENGASVILMMGAHVIRAGVQRYLIDLMERGCITHIAMNGAGPIHDYEFALIGATTESVARYIRTGEFGLWEETGRVNDTAVQAAREGIGLGEAIGREVSEGDFPHRDVSVLAAAYRLGVPATVHIGIGYDIIHEHPNADAAALGAASYTDFLVLANAVENLERGVLLNFGTAVMGPEVYLKALAMARNVARQEGRSITDFTTLVCDLVPLGDDTDHEAPKTDPHYYFRPWKTILVRTVADGGEGYYVQGDHRVTIPNLHGRVPR